MKFIDRIMGRRNEDRREEGLQAVYALNLCMVSLSQIVDYADINVLRQEYDSILNNLNLEVMPKDEALLTAIKQILDTCHFYILHQKDKELLAKKQELRLSNALGNAISGGVFAIFSTPNPWAIAVSAATMVGGAAVRCKTERRKAMLESEIEAWQLEKTALEQLHNLRRTLFETAWRLSKEYGFSDGLRLTELQIKSYNEILTDPDPQSRYERLSLIKNDFAAYPLFWYYLGRSAMEAAELFLPGDERRKRLGCNEDVDVTGAFLGVEARASANDAGSRDEAMAFYDIYRKEAEKAFDKFKRFYDDSEAGGKLRNLLREDVVSASAWLDASDFCKTDKDELAHIERAYNLAGGNVELLQTCAFRYLRLFHGATAGGDSPSGKLSEMEIKICVAHAENCLRKLISADVRTELNGRALGILYRKAHDLFNGAFAVDSGNGEPWNFDPRDRYLRMKVALSSKHAFVPMWLRPWDASELATEWGRYLSGEGLKRSLACFLDGRMRILLHKFYAALESDIANGTWQGLATLKSDWGNAEAKVVVKGSKPEIELGNACFKNVHKRFWYESEECKSSLLPEDMASATVAAAFKKFATSADCAKGRIEKEAELYNRIANFVSKSESGWMMWKHNPDIPVSQCADEIEAIENALRRFIAEASGTAAGLIKRELEFDSGAGKSGESSKETAVAYLYDEKMPRNPSTPLCVAFVQSIEKKVEDLRLNIARSRMDGRFTFPAYWASLPNGVVPAK